MKLAWLVIIMENLHGPIFFYIFPVILGAIASSLGSAVLAPLIIGEPAVYLQFTLEITRLALLFPYLK